MSYAYIYDAVRSPRGRGRSDGALHDVTSLSLASQMLSAIRDRSFLDTALVDDVILGCVMPIGEQGSNIARIAALVSGYDQGVPGLQVNRFCASGLEACNIAAAKVASREARLVAAGGVESMSRVPLGADGGAMMVDPNFAFDHCYVPQGVSADVLATINDFTREDVDAYAVQSHHRAAAAWNAGRFKRSVVPILDQAGGIRLAHDEIIRPQSDMRGMASLKPAFTNIGERGYDAVARLKYPELEIVEHVHHAGNSSAIADGAAMVLIGSKEAGDCTGLTPRARILGGCSIGSEPTIMLTGPETVTEKLLGRLRMKTTDIDLFEINEAFAAVVLRYIRALNLDPGKVNINGGAIAMGHPLGATGAMLLGTAIDEMERSNQETALICLCVGAGMGTATVIERV